MAARDGEEGIQRGEGGVKRAWTREKMAARDGEDGKWRAWTEEEAARGRRLVTGDDAGWTAREARLPKAFIIMTMKGAWSPT